MDVIISALSPFYMKGFIGFGFHVSIWNIEIVRDRLRPIWLPSRLFHFHSFQCDLGFLLRCGTRPHEWDSESNSLVKVC